MRGLIKLTTAIALIFGATTFASGQHNSVDGRDVIQTWPGTSEGHAGMMLAAAADDWGYDFGVTAGQIINGQMVEDSGQPQQRDRPGFCVEQDASLRWIRLRCENQFYIRSATPHYPSYDLESYTRMMIERGRNSQLASQLAAFYRPCVEARQRGEPMPRTGCGAEETQR